MWIKPEFGQDPVVRVGSSAKNAGFFGNIDGCGVGKPPARQNSWIGNICTERSWVKGIFSRGDTAAPQLVPHPCGLFQRRDIPWNSLDSTPGGARQGCVHGIPVALGGDTLGVSQSPGVLPVPLPFLGSDRVHKSGHHGQIRSLSCRRPLPKAGKSWESQRPDRKSVV